MLAKDVILRFVDRKFDKRDTSKANKEVLCETAIEAVEKLMEDGSQYWTNQSNENSKAIEVWVLGRLSYVTGAIPELFGTDEKILRECQVALNKFDTALTGGDFQGANKQPDQNRATDVMKDGFELIIKFRSAKNHL